MLVGLTGGIGSGKSTALKMFGKLGAATIDADRIVEELYRKDNVKVMLALHFGSEVVSHGKVDRKALAKKVFSGRKLLAQLNALVHPLVADEIIKRAREIHGRNRKKIIFVEAALLIESGMEKNCDRIVVVTCRRDEQVKRLVKSGYSRKDALLRINSQMRNQHRVSKADFVIYNPGSIKELSSQVKRLFAELSRKAHIKKVSRK